VKQTPAPLPLDPELATRIRRIWESTRSHAARTVNSAHVCANWLIGRQIVDAEQGGASRAGYGTQLLEKLSENLSRDLGAGFAVSSLKYMRLFYLGYPELLPIRHALRDESASPEASGPTAGIRHALRDEFADAGVAALIGTALLLPQELAGPDRDDGWKPGRLHSRLAWTHYRTLLKVESRTARDFYEIEAVKNGWSARQLERQVHSLLFERLLKSRDREGLLALANEGQVIAEPADAIKDPYVLEFLGLPASHRLAETELETALLSQLQSFLLELGSGFAFVGRQVRLTLDGDHFYPDLVFYHVKLKCYVVIDLKITKLSHADLGQMQLYVNYYDREIAEAADNPTIGLILCTEKNEAVVRYVLDEKRKQIFASRYQLHLPTEEQLRVELRREIDRVNVPARSEEENG
jgi:predicted nuclease of restriction endonuclease-like (RecB) superfamily